MSTPRANAPLVELIAELRWEPEIPSSARVAGAPTGATFISAQSSETDAFFMRFAGAAHSLGHTEQERVVPPGFPIFAHQPVYRFKRTEDGVVTTLFQVGPGLLSINAVPPYQSWERFETVLNQGIVALLNARGKAETDREFMGLSLRYIDAFTPHHTQGQSIGRFLADVLKISVQVPPALSGMLRSDGEVKPSVHLQIPMTDGLLMTIGIGEGVANSAPAVVMDTAVTTTLPTPADAGAAAAFFAAAHDAISTSFKQLMQPIDHLMPEKK